MMSIYKLVIASLKHYFRSNLLITIGIAVSTAVITGALIVGDSVKYSLEQTVTYRLGNITHTITAGDRFFTQELAQRISGESNSFTSTGLVLEGIALADGGQLRLDHVQIVGIDSNFARMADVPEGTFSLEPGEILISENAAARLDIQPDDMLLIRIRKASLIPLNAPLVSDVEQTVSRQVRVKGIAGKEQFGRFNLRASQTAPFNIFVNIDWLNQIMELEDKANIVFVRENEDNDQSPLLPALRQSWHAEDAGLKLESIDAGAAIEITSERVFIDTALTHIMLQDIQGARPILTYFVNSVLYRGQETPYSFVSSLPDSMLPENGMIISTWMADDINAGPGDTLTIDYFEIGPLRELEVHSARFTVTGITPVDGPLSDPSLMPDLPGMSDAGSCRDWEAGIPIDLEKIRDKDEDYWDEYRGTPKAFITISKAQELWQNRFGNLTSIRINASDFSEEEIRNTLAGNLDPVALGFRVNEVKSRGLQSASGGVDFGQLFLGLSFFILVSGILLAALLIIFNLERRKEQIGTLASMGFSRSLIRKIFISEGLLVSVSGAIIGTVFAVLYGRLVFNGLNRVWQDIVRTEVLEMTVNPLTLTIGFTAGVVISWTVIFLILRRHLRSGIAHLQKKTAVTSHIMHSRIRIASIVITLMGGVGLLVWQFIRGGTLNPAVFLVSGALFLMGFMVTADTLILKTAFKSFSHLNPASLSYKNLTRNRLRSLTVIILLGLGTFTIVATGSNRKDLEAQAQEPSSGTGGFLFLAESTVPVLKNLNLADSKFEYGIPEEVNFVQFRVHEGDDASCLNLNRVTNPRILGIDPVALQGRFSFVSATDELDRNDPWKSLETEGEMGVIPAIADQTVIQWGLGLQVGDTLHYVKENGDTIRLYLIGGLANSIFQGNVIISKQHFLDLFPTSVGTSFFLVDGNFDNSEDLAADLSFAFSDLGWYMVPAVERLAEFATVQNTYLQIFLVMGAFGLLLGTIGLAVVLAKSLVERRQELALMQSAGFRFQLIFRIIFREYSMLLLAGMAAGIVASVVATLPSFLTGNQNISADFLAMLIIGIILNGIFWIALITWIQLRKMHLVDALRND